MEFTRTLGDIFYQVAAVALFGSLAFQQGFEYRTTGELASGALALGYVLWVASAILPGSGLGKYFSHENPSVRYKARVLGTLNIASMLAGLSCIAAGFFLPFRDAA